MDNFKINSKFQSIKELILDNIVNFNSKGRVLVNGQRNAIKLFDVDDITLNIKSFKKPNLIKYILCITINISNLLDIPQIQLQILRFFFNINKSHLIFVIIKVISSYFYAEDNDEKNIRNSFSFSFL
jgi:hypothetical protein